MKKLLVVVDYQNDFVTGSLGFPRAKEIEKNIVKKIQEFVAEKNDIVFTLDTHEENYLESSEGKNIPIKHTIRNTDGWQIFGEVKSLTKFGKILIKNTFGCSKLEEHLKGKNYQQIEFVGVVTHMCVLSNVILCKTFSPESEIVVHANAIGDYDLDLEKKTIDLFKSIHIKVK